MKTNLLVFLSILISGAISAQTDWSKLDFTKEYKGKAKINKSSVKLLKNNKTFVNGYSISQATVMKGSESSSTKAVFS